MRILLAFLSVMVLIASCRPIQEGPPPYGASGHSYDQPPAPYSKHAATRPPYLSPALPLGLNRFPSARAGFRLGSTLAQAVARCHRHFSNCRIKYDVKKFMSLSFNRAIMQVRFRRPVRLRSLRLVFLNGRLFSIRVMPANRYLGRMYYRISTRLGRPLFTWQRRGVWYSRGLRGILVVPHHGRWAQLDYLGLPVRLGLLTQQQIKTYFIKRYWKKRYR